MNFKMNFKKNFKKLGFRTPSSFRAQKALKLGKRGDRRYKEEDIRKIMQT